MAICVKKGISYNKFEILKDLEGISITIKSNRVSVEIINLYCSPLVPLEEDKLLNVFQRKDALICGDFNAKSLLWGRHERDYRGNIIEKMLEQSDKVLLNNGQNTHIYNMGESAIDLAFASPRLARLAEWGVLERTCGSDHYLIGIDVNIRTSVEEYISQRWVFKRAKWDKFQEECDLLLKEISINSKSEVEIVSKNITDILIKVAEKNIPKTKGGNKIKKSSEFWNEDCKNAVKEREAAKRKVRSSRLPSDWIEYKKCKAKATKVIKDAKRKKWRNFCSSLSGTSNLNKVWKVVKKFNNTDKDSKIPSLIVEEKEIVDNQEKANILAESFANVSSSSNYFEDFRVHKENFEKEHEEYFKYKENDESSINVEFKMSELQKALKKCKSTSPGKDQICYEMFRHMSSYGKKVLLKLYNLIWEKGVLPTSWKHAVTIPILKPGKLKSDPLSYRPIALTSNMGKLMERMITNRLNWVVEKGDILNVNQAGFRKKRNTLDHLIRLSDDILKAIATKQYVLGVFLDIEKAYDMIWKKGLLYKISNIGIGGNMFNWINDFLKNRTMQVRLGAMFSEVQNVENGTPQGSVISPILFLLAINDIQPQNINSSLFADDTAIWKTGKNVKLLAKQVQQSINYIEDWCNKWGFKVSVAKTKAVLFHRGKTKKYKLNFRGIPLEQEKKVKFLGLIFDKRLTWKDHIEYLTNRCKKRINLMKVVSGAYWGACKETLVILYRNLIRSCIDYGCEIYDSTVKTNKMKIDRIQSQCLRVCCGALRSTPINALQVDCGEMPLELRRLQLQCKAMLKYKSFKNHPTNTCFQNGWQEEYGVFKDSFRTIYSKTKDIIENLPKANDIIVVENIPSWEYEGCITSLELSKIINKNESPHVNLALTKEYMEKWNNYLHIYTDGSKFEEKTACSFNVPAVNYEFKARLSNNTSVFDSELCAILKALQWLDSNPPFQCVILSDSLSALQALKDDENKNALIGEIRYNVFMLQNKGIRIYLAWIPSHIGLKGNERADKAAKRALNNDKVDLQITPEYESVFNIVKKKIMEKWQKLWDTSEKGRFYYNIVPVVSLDVKFSDKYRYKEVKITRVRFNHCLLNSKLHLMRKHVDGNCEFCLIKEDVEHFFLNCLQYIHLQETIVNAMLEKELVINITNLLGNKYLVDLVWEYIVKSKKVV